MRVDPTGGCAPATRFEQELWAECDRYREALERIAAGQVPYPGKNPARAFMKFAQLVADGLSIEEALWEVAGRPRTGVKK